jgi:hypothetical protein
MIDTFTLAQPRQYIVLLFQAILRDNPRNRLSYHLLRPIAEQSLSASAPAHDDAGQRFTDDCVLAILNDRGKLAEPPLCLLAILSGIRADSLRYLSLKISHSRSRFVGLYLPVGLGLWQDLDELGRVALKLPNSELRGFTYQDKTSIE